MKLSVLLALVAVTSGIKINEEPAPLPTSDTPKKGPFDKSDEEEKIEKFAFSKEKSAMLKD